MKNSTTFYLIRHGESEGNASFLAGKIDDVTSELGTALTEEGISQAKQLAKSLRNIPFEAAFSSDLLRAKQTAEIIASERKLVVNTDKTIRERSFEKYRKQFFPQSREKLMEEIKNALKNMNETEKMEYKHSSNMESAKEGALRLINFLKETANSYQGKNVLVVAHGNIMRAMLTYLGFSKFDELPSGSIENAGYVVLESNDFGFLIKSVHGINKQKNQIRIF